MSRDVRDRIVVEAPIWVKPGEQAPMIGAIERAVRAQPSQWFNVFDVGSPPVAAV